MEDTSLIIKIGATTKNFESALKKIQGETKALETQLKGLAQNSVIAFAALGATTVGLVTAFAKFDEQMRLVKTNLDDTSFGAVSLSDGFKKMTADALDLGKKVPVNINSIAGSLFDTVSAGVEAAGAIKVVGAAAHLAVAGLTDVSIATDGLTSALNSFHISADKANSVASKFYEAQLYGKTTVGELAGGLGVVSSTAANLGVSLNELLAAVSAVTLGGKKTTEAFTGLKALLSNIAKPTADAQAEAARLGVQFNANALQAKGLSKFLSDLTNAQGFNKDSAVKLFGSIQALDLAFSLTGSQATNFHNILGVLNNDQKTQAALDQAYQINLGSLSAQWTVLTNNIKAYAIELGGDLAPVASKMLAAASSLVTILSQNKGLVEFTAYTVAAGTALSGTILAITAGTLAFLKFRAAILAVETSSALLGPVYQTVRFAIASTTLSIQGMALSIKGLAAATGIGLLIVALSELYMHWDQVWRAATATFRAFADQISNIGAAVGQVITGLFTFDGNQISSGLQATKDALIQSFDEIVENYQESEAKKTAAVQRGAADREKARDDENKKHVDDQIQTNQKILDLQSQFQAAALEANQTAAEVNAEAELSGVTQQLQIKTNERMQDAMIRQGFDLQQERQDAKNRIQYVKDETKYGTTIAKLKQTFRSKEFAATQTALGSLTTLTQSHNKTLFTIGKIAAEANAVINVAQGVTRSLAEYPWPFSLVAAAAQAVAGAVQISTIQNQTLGYAKGGPIIGGIRGIDSVPILAQPGELITPVQNFDETVNAVADKRNLERRGGFASSSDPEEFRATIVLELKDQLMDFFEAKLIERNRLNIALGVV